MDYVSSFFNYVPQNGNAFYYDIYDESKINPNPNSARLNQ